MAGRSSVKAIYVARRNYASKNALWSTAIVAFAMRRKDSESTHGRRTPSTTEQHSGIAIQLTFLVLGATGGTGKHFVARALADGHKVRALVRSRAEHLPEANNLEVRHGSITDMIDTDELVAGVDFVVAMLGDKNLQRNDKINTAFVKRLVPSMRRHGANRFLYQAGGLSRPYGMRLSPVVWMLRHTLARGFIGQHQDNDAVMAYLATEARDIEWIVHRAGIGSDGPSKGTLERSKKKLSVATHIDCAAYNYRTITDASAVHTADLSRYTAC